MNCPAFEKLPTAEAQSAKRKFSEIEGQGEEVVPSVACIEQDLNEHQSAYTKAFFHDYKKNPCSQKCLFNEESIRGMTDTLLTYNTNLDEQIEVMLLLLHHCSFLHAQVGIMFETLIYIEIY